MGAPPCPTPSTTTTTKLVSAPAGVFLLTNLVSACAIVFANKVVFSVFGFNFTVALTCIHTVATLLAAKTLCAAGVITRKLLPTRAVASLAAAFTGYIIICNVSLALNSVGFYQLTKIAIAPVVLIMEAAAQRRLPKLSVSLCVLVVCTGIGLATVFDATVMTNLPGLIVGLVSVVVSAQYGMWIGTMTKHYAISSLQLLEQYLPYASAMLAVCVPLEQMVMLTDASKRAEGEHQLPRGERAIKSNAYTLLTFPYSTGAVAAITLSAVLGVLVTFSTFLVIGRTSPLTYAVAGHVKTIVILGGGVLLFGDRVSPAKGLGLVIALAGVIAYTWVKSSASESSSASSSIAGSQSARRVIK